MSYEISDLTEEKAHSFCNNKPQLTTSHTSSRYGTFGILQETSHESSSIGQTFISVFAFEISSTKDRFVVGGYDKKERKRIGLVHLIVSLRGNKIYS